MKILLILPVIAIGFYSFAKPEYHYLQPVNNTMTVYETPGILTNVVKGIVLKEDGKPFSRVSIIVSGTTFGGYTDINGRFVIDRIPDEASLIFSFQGYKSKVLKPVFGSDLTVIMTEDTENGVQVNNTNNSSIPLLKFIQIRGKELISPLYVIDGIITDVDSNKINIDPESVISIEVLKDKSATDKYGEKGKDGVIEITTKKAVERENEKKMPSTLIIESGSCDTIKVSAYGGVQFKHDYEKNAISLYVLDDVIISIDDLNKANPETFKVINVMKGKSAIDKYGEKGKDGVIEITTKK
jgi:hypothetical protein